jgi:tetratricopeptide (TPR) repeat protein
MVIGGGACAASRSAGPPVVTTAKFAQYPMPEIPPSLRVTGDLRERHGVAWQRLQAGDLGGANRDFSTILKRAPWFYPAEAGLGFVQLANRQFKSAASRFAAALALNGRYVPAWIGQADAQIGLNDEQQAIAAMERVLVIDPKRDAIRSRLELVRFKQLQELIEAGRRARAAGRLEAARDAFERALTLSPAGSSILRELALVESKAGRIEAAEVYARKAVQADPADVDAYAVLAAVLESREQYREAAAALSRAAAIDPRPEWRTRAAALRERADLAALPTEFGNLAGAATITRAHVVAFVGIKLRSLIDAAPHRATAVATDVRTHWALPWIVPVIRAGVMDLFANHTFQPSARVRRNDLAQVVGRLLPLASARRPADLTAWRAARPKFADVPSTNVFYRSVAVAVASGAMTADVDGRFLPAAPATGADLTAAVARIDQIAR